MFDISALNLALVALFGAVLLLALGAANLIGSGDAVRRRLAGEAPRPVNAPRGGTRVLLRAGNVSSSDRRESVGPLNFLVRGRQRAVGRHMQSRLRQAGITNPRAPRAYVFTQVILSIAVPLSVSAAAPTLFAGVAWWWAAGMVLGLAVAGFALPVAWLARMSSRRWRKIQEGFPDALDLMVVCVEAGLGLDAALARVGSQMASVHPLLAGELEWVTLELRAGKSRDDALRDLVRRVPLPEVASFVTLLIQSEMLGASVAQTLRAHAEDMRANRLLRAEELAHKLPVKLTVPLVLCLLPAMLVAVLLPGMLTIARTVLPSLGQ